MGGRRNGRVGKDASTGGVTSRCLGLTALSFSGKLDLEGGLGVEVTIPPGGNDGGMKDYVRKKVKSVEL